jgi:hypothetical protein
MLPCAQIPAYASTGKAPSAEGVARLAEEPELDKAVVDSYIETLRNAVSARKSGQGATMDQIKAMFADEPVTAEAADAAEDVNEYNQLLAAKEPEVQPLSIDLEAQVGQAGIRACQLSTSHTGTAVPHCQLDSGSNTGGPVPGHSMACRVSGMGHFITMWVCI